MTSHEFYNNDADVDGQNLKINQVELYTIDLIKKDLNFQDIQNIITEEFQEDISKLYLDTLKELIF